MRQWGREFIQYAADFVYPPSCPFCESPIESELTGRRSLCERCRPKLIPTMYNRCQRCSAPLGPGLRESAE